MSTAAPPPLVAHVIHHLVTGGMENGLVNIVNNMPAGTFRHMIVCVEDASEFRKRIRREDVRVLELHRSKIGPWRLRKALYDGFREWRPAIVHSRGLSGLDALIPAKLAGVAHTVHGEHGWDVSDIDGKRWKPKLLRKLHSPFVERYVTVSEDLKNFLISRVGIGANRISAICNGVDTERFQPSATPDLEWLPQSFRGSDLVRFGTVGRLQPVKDQATLIRALALAIKSSPSDLAPRLRLIIVGDGPLREELAGLAESLGVSRQVFFAGDRNDVPRVLQSFDAFALSSLNEGISNTILEAMATGLPLIVTGVGGNVELVPGGEIGAHFAAGDTGALASLLISYGWNEELRSVQGQAARQRALHRYSLTGMVFAYQSLYEQLIGRATNLQQPYGDV